MSKLISEVMRSVNNIIQRKFYSPQFSNANNFEIINMYRSNSDDIYILDRNDSNLDDAEDIEDFKCELENAFEIARVEFMRKINVDHYPEIQMTKYYITSSYTVDEEKTLHKILLYAIITWKHKNTVEKKKIDSSLQINIDFMTVTVIVGLGLFIANYYK